MANQKSVSFNIDWDMLTTLILGLVLAKHVAKFVDPLLSRLSGATRPALSGAEIKALAAALDQKARGLRVTRSAARQEPPEFSVADRPE